MRIKATDKGFGPALGPAAAAFMIARFKALGYSRHSRCVRLGHGTGRSYESKPKFWPDGQVLRKRWARCRSPMRPLGLRDAATPLTPDAPHSALVTSIFLQCRAPRAERQIAVEQHIVLDFVHAYGHACA